MSDIIQKLVAAAIDLPPAPWRKVGSYAIGGLLAVGYVENTDYLLIVSSQGRGLFDCLSAAKLERDHEAEGKWLDEVRLTAQGIGPASKKEIRLAGLFGGGLPLITRDGWSLTTVVSPWPHTSVFLQKPYTSVYQNIESGIKVAADNACEFRVTGFSETGNSFIVATSCDITMFSRSE